MADMEFTALTLFWMFIGAVAVGGFSFIMLMILAMFTPAMSFLRAKMRKVPLLAVRRSDRKIDFVPCTKFIEPLAIHKEYGGYMVDADSVYSSQKGGVSILPVNSEIGVVLKQQILGIIDALKKAKINNIDEADWLSDRWGKCECGYVGLMDLIENKLICPVIDIDEEEKHDEPEGDGKGADSGNDEEPQREPAVENRTDAPYTFGADYDVQL